MGKPRYITADEAAELLGVKRRTLDSYRSRDTTFPAPDRMRGTVAFWDRATLTTWKRSRPGRGVGGGHPTHRATIAGRLRSAEVVPHVRA